VSVAARFWKIFGVVSLEYKWIALTVTTIGIFMVGLDSRIAIIGLPQIAQQLHAGAEQAIWITQSYVMATTVMLLLIGRLADIFGRVRIYSYGFAIFTIGSALTSLGFDSTQVIIYRAVQGLGASLIFANSIAIVTDASPKNELGLFVGINQISFRAGAVLGLTLSGIILSFLDWRALFYINIPIGIFGTFWARKRLKEVAKLDKNRKVDRLGFILFAIFLLALMLGLTISAYGLENVNTIYPLFATSILFLALFAIRERRIDYALLDLKMFKTRAIVGGVSAVFLNVIAWAGVLLLLSLQFQLILGETAFQAGTRILPFEIAFLAVGPLSGWLSDKFGYVRFTVGGLILGSIALFLLSTVLETTPYSILAIFMVLLCIGTGLFLAPNLRGVMGALPQDRRGIGSALVSLFLNIGLTISLNFVILFISFTAPYGVITNIISGLNPTAVTAADRMLFFASVKNTYFALGAMNAVAIFPSLLQISRHRLPKTADKKGLVVSPEG
jgi:EmrB/QacA subfamily drug resistance transporter